MIIMRMEWDDGIELIDVVGFQASAIAAKSGSKRSVIISIKVGLLNQPSVIQLVSPSSKSKVVEPVNLTVTLPAATSPEE